jgi:hypothetical protein
MRWIVLSEKPLYQDEWLGIGRPTVNSPEVTG